MNARRRDQMRKELNQYYASPCSQHNPVTEYLFDDNIGSQLKNISETNKVGQKRKQNRHSTGHRYQPVDVKRRRPFLHNRPSPSVWDIQSKRRAGRSATSATQAHNNGPSRPFIKTRHY
jgi:hypothetical protein